MQILFNGKTYNSLEEMPANERQAYEHIQAVFKDENQNGVPDIFEGDVVKNIVTTSLTKSFVNGQEVGSLDSLTPEQRAKYEQALKVLERLGIAQPAATAQAASPSPAFDFAFQPSKPLVSQEPAGGGVGRTRGLVLIIAIAVALFICATGAALFFFLQ